MVVDLLSIDKPELFISVYGHYKASLPVAWPIMLSLHKVEEVAYVPEIKMEEISNVSTSTSGTQLSEQARINLRRNAELRNRDSKFVSVQPGEKLALLFDAEKIEPIEREFDGKKVQRLQYRVKDTTTDREKVWTVSKRTSEQLDAFLSEGHTLLKIQRVGLGKDTRYYIIPA